LTVEKTVNVDWAMPGDTLTYTIRIQETGPNVTLWMTDTLPEEVTYVANSLQQQQPILGSAGYANGVITWTASNFGVGNFAVITFSAKISSETTATAIENTAQVTGTGVLITDSAKTTMLTGQPPNSQIRSPDKDALITQKGSLTISGIAWEEGVAPPYLVDDPELSVQRVSDRSYYVSWTAVVSAEDYILQEATQPDFSDQTSTSVSAPSTNKLITKGAADDGTYYYRVQASRYGLNPSRWSNVESVVVPWTAASANLSASGLSTDIATNGSITVQVRIDDGDWHTAVVTATDWGGWDWTYDWALPEERDVQHTIHTRASGANGTGLTDTITVTLNNKIYVVYFPRIFRRWPPIPYAPTLNDIDNADEDGNYTVSWSYNYPVGPTDVDTYTLQEAADTNFANPTNYYPGSSKLYAISDKDSGTYYYRVRGNNGYGPGEWSNVKSVTVRSYSYHYEFNSATTIPNSWPIRRTSLYEGDKWGGVWTQESENSLFIVADDKYDFVIASPLEVAPSPPYVIQTRVKTHDPANLVAYGVVFGGNSGSPCPAYRDSGCFYHYYRLEVIWDGGALKAGFKRIDSHEADKGKGRGDELIEYGYVSGDPNGWHTWKFEVKSNGIDIYYDGSLFGHTDDHAYVNSPYFGVYASANEYKPAIGRFDYYHVDPQ